MCSVTAAQCHIAICAGGAKACPCIVTLTYANAAQPLPYISRLGESRFCCCLKCKKLTVLGRRPKVSTNDLDSIMMQHSVFLCKVSRSQIRQVNVDLTGYLAWQLPGVTVGL